MKSFSAAHNGAQDHDFLAAIRARNAIENLAPRERANLAATLDAVLLANFGIKQTQIMVNLSDRSDSGFFSTLAEPLLDRHRRWNTGEKVNVRPRHHLQELARISGKTIDVAPLAFRIDNIERQG